MADKQVGEVQIPLQILQKVENLRPHGHVQGGHRLVAHHESRIGGQGPCDHDPLALASRKLVGIAVQLFLLQVHQAHKLLHPGHPRLFVPVVVDDQRFLQNRADAHLGVQGPEGVLKDDLNVLALALQLFLIQLPKIFPFIKDFAPGRLDETQHGAHQRGLSTAGLSHQPQSLALVHLERHVVHGLHITHCL